MTGNVWTPAMIATFRALHRGEDSFDAMAQKMSAIFGLEISRNALIGKARRLELPMRHGPGTRKPPQYPAKPAKIPRPVSVAAPIPPEPEPTVPEVGLSIYQLTNATCRWPLGKVSDRPPYRYCGGATEIEVSYCDEHRAIAHRGFARVGLVPEQGK